MGFEQKSAYISIIHVLEEIPVFIKIKPNKASGPDNIQLLFLKETTDKLVPALSNQSKIPDECRHAKAVPVFKQGNGNLGRFSLTTMWVNVATSILVRFAPDLKLQTIFLTIYVLQHIRTCQAFADTHLKQYCIHSNMGVVLSTRSNFGPSSRACRCRGNIAGFMDV